MSKPVRKSLIGAFVVGAIALLVLAIAIFGSGRFLAKRAVVVMFFQGSVKGLNVGAPVVFRGVPIGSVKQIDMVVDLKKVMVQIPVYAEIDSDRIKRVDQLQNLAPGQVGWEVRLLVQAGLRAELELQSLVTGQLVINLDFFPETKAVLVGGDLRYPEIPTKPTGLQQFVRKIETLPLDELVRNLNDTVVGLNKLVNSPELTATVRNLSEVTQDLKPFLANLDRQVERLAPTIDQTVKEYGQLARTANAQVEQVGSKATDVAADVQKLVEDVDREVPALAAGLQKTLEDVQATLAQARQTLAKAENFLSDDGEVGYELTRTMSEISGAARSIRQLADFLNRDPDAIIWGRSASGGR